MSLNDKQTTNKVHFAPPSTCHREQLVPSRTWHDAQTAVRLRPWRLAAVPFSGLHSAEAPYESSERMHEAEGEDATVTPQRVPV